MATNMTDFPVGLMTVKNLDGDPKISGIYG